MRYPCAAQLFWIVASAVLTSGAAVAQPTQEPHDSHRHGAAADAVSTAAAPTLEILMPGNDDVIGHQVAVVLETAADLDATTMSAPKIGVHLHLELEGVSLMPTRQQLIDLGNSRYLFLFDLPAKSGRNTIKVYWADAAHRLIESSMRSVTVNVEP